MGIHTKLPVFLLLVTIAGFSVSVTAGSPISANGLGSEIPESVGRARGMGGVGLAKADGINYMHSNPALLSGVSRYTFGFGATYMHEKTDTVAGSESYAKTLPDYISISVPLFKNIVVGWNMAPYTRTDTDMLISSIQNGIAVNDNLSMVGGLNISTAGIAASYKDIVRIGYSMNYMFGLIQEEWIRRFPDNADMNATRFYLKQKYNGYSQTYGIILTPFPWISVATSYTTKTSLDNNNIAVIGSLTNDEIEVSKNSLELPTVLRAGVYADLGGKFEGGLDIAFKNWEDAAITNTEKLMYNDSFKLGTGLRYVPESRPGTPYLKTIPLSIGYRMNTLYYKSYPLIDSVYEKAFSMGAEFPLKNDLGSMFFTFEAGTRGDKSSNGWEQLFTGFSIALIGKVL